jgi:hypothetical protein
MAIVMTSTPESVIAQILEFSEFHTWTDVATIYYFSDHLRYEGEYGIRGFVIDDNWTLVYLRPSVRYKDWVEKVALHGSAALFYNSFKDADDLPELRPCVGVRLKRPVTGTLG